MRNIRGPGRAAGGGDFSRERGERREAEAAMESSVLRRLGERIGPGRAAALAAAHRKVSGARARLCDLMAANPYDLLELASHVSWRLEWGAVDEIALSWGAGVPRLDPRRLSAALRAALSAAGNRDGHSWVEAGELRLAAVRLAGLRPEEFAEAACMMRLASGPAFEVVGGGGAPARVYLKDVYQAERRAARGLAQLISNGPESCARALSQEDCAGLSDEQAEAVRTALAHPVSVLTGGPGTGKSHTVASLIRAARRGGAARVALCAPTGKAARRLGEGALTVARLIGWGGVGGATANRFAPLAADLLVCDESSMLDVELFARLAEAVAPGTRVVLVGDVDQLPPVGFGAPFSEVIASGLVPVARLTRTFRQAGDSGILSAAHAVRDGLIPSLTVMRPGARGDALFLPLEERSADAAVVDLVTRRLPREFGVEPEGVRVLAPRNAGPWGADRFARALRSAGGFSGGWSEGDRLLWLENDYELGLMNGTELLVTAAYRGEVRLRALGGEGGEELTLDRRDVRARSALAFSVHRSQGSEFPAAVVICPPESPDLTRALVYTGMTRAKSLLVVAGDVRSLASAVGTPAPRRRSGFASALREETAG